MKKFIGASLVSTICVALAWMTFGWLLSEKPTVAVAMQDGGIAVVKKTTELLPGEWGPRTESGLRAWIHFDRDIPIGILALGFFLVPRFLIGVLRALRR